MSKPIRAVVVLAIILLAALAVALFSSAGRRSNTSDLPQSFTSPINGYSINLPSGWTVHAAKAAWPTGQEINDGSAPYLDQFLSTDETLFVASQPVAAGDSSAWAVGQFPMNAFWFPADGCLSLVLSPVQISGASGNLDASCPSNGYRADVASRGRGYVFILRGTLHDEAWFRKLLATVVLPG